MPFVQGDKAETTVDDLPSLISIGKIKSIVFYIWLSFFPSIFLLIYIFCLSIFFFVQLILINLFVSIPLI